MIKGLLRQKLAGIFLDVDFDILIPPDEKMGDYSTNIAFALARANRENKEGTDSAEKIAENLVRELKLDKNIADIFEKVEAVQPGFVNFFLKKEFLQRQLAEIYKKLDSFGKSEKGNGRTAIIEYSSPNIAKPMHIGHLRSTIIGDALANVYEALGYKVIRWNYLGDWGTQFGKLIVAYKDLVSRVGQTEADIQFFGGDTTLGIAGHYIKYHQDYRDDERAREEFRKLENSDQENLGLWRKIRELSLRELASLTYPSIGININEPKMFFKGESDYESDLKPLIECLIKLGIAKESEGALIVELENLPPALLRKSDGATLYITRDIASLKDRIENPEFNHPAKILYVVANQQTLHFEQLFAVAKKLKLDSAELIHVKFGMVLSEDGKKLATREGKVILLQEVIDKIIVLAGKVVREKNPELSEKESNEIARTVGIGALKYNDLKQHPHTDIVFDWKAMLDISGNSGPYIQYAYSRLFSILKNAEQANFQFSIFNFQLLDHELELRLMKRLLKFPDTIENCAKQNALNGLALYLYELANDANRFYESIRILNDKDTDRRDARLMLISTVSSVLKMGLNLLGIDATKRI